MLLAKTIPDPWLSAGVLLLLGFVLAVSWLVFWLLSERSTSRRQSVAIEDWASEHGYRLQFAPSAPPRPFDDLASRGIVARICLTHGPTMLLQLEDPAARPISGRGSASLPPRWNLLVRALSNAWHPTGLRPTHGKRSALDLFSLTSFPLLGPTDRFIVYGTDSVAARALSRSSARGLLPPDIGLLLAGQHLVLDFTARPFDQIEFNRMIAVADQLAGHLPQQVSQ